FWHFCENDISPFYVKYSQTGKHFSCTIEATRGALPLAENGHLLQIHTLPLRKGDPACESIYFPSAVNTPHHSPLRQSDHPLAAAAGRDAPGTCRRTPLA